MVRRGFTKPTGSSAPPSIESPLPGRVGCVSLPAFPLQLLLRKHPDWDGLPAAVVDQDKPQGILLWVNEEARRNRILPGMKYAAGLSLARELRAGVISPEDVKTETAEIETQLRFFTPDVEPSADEDGIFWLGAEGLNLLYPSLVRWARLIRQALEEMNFDSDVVVGFSRFGVYAAARCGVPKLLEIAYGTNGAVGSDDVRAPSRRPQESNADLRSHRSVAFRTPALEAELVRKLPIDRLGFDTDLRDTLAKLGIYDLGGFLDLPPEGIQKRFGSDAVRLHQVARGELWDPVRPQEWIEPFVCRHIYEDPEENRDRLLERMFVMLRRTLDHLRSSCAEMASVEWCLAFEHDGQGDRNEDGERKPTTEMKEQLRAARPTLDEKQWRDLLRLRFERLEWPAGVIELTLQGQGIRVDQRQLELFAAKPTRDLEAAARAFARLRAEFGEHAVVRARLREGHLPEAHFSWEKMESLEVPRAHPVYSRPLIRRLLSRPRPLPTRPRFEPDGWLVTGLEGGTAEEILGPYVVSGGWWQRAVHREYHFIRTAKGRWLWVFYDRERRRWFLHGEVE